MGGRDGLQLGSCLGVGLLLMSIFGSIQAQSTRFISIDCGSTPYKDAVTTFLWEGDENYTLTGLSGTVPITVNSTLDNSEALKTFRYFPADGRSKHCYVLPTSGNITFLLRAMFLHGTSPELTLPINFDVAINSTILFPVQYNSSDSDALSTPIVYEGIFQSPGNLTHLCLVTGTGVPFISSLELREFEPQGITYTRTLQNNSVYLENKWRINCGAQVGSPTVRYPDDPFDRLWQSPGNWGLTGFESFTGNVSSLATPAGGTENNAPLKVMQDAWLNDTANSSWTVNFPGTGSAESLNIPFAVASVFFYIQEIEPGVSNGDRVFDIVVDAGAGSWQKLRSDTDYVSVDYDTDFSLPDELANFKITARPNSKLGPILNAVEIYAQYLFDDSTTAAGDVEALASLQASFNLTDWQGDPCYPVSWEWVTCTGDTPARVQKLLLSRMGINASIPPTISDLDALTEINLANNSLYGTIPDALAALQNLRLLALDDNNLSGDLPSDLVNTLGSNFTYSGNLLLNSNSTTKKKATNIGLTIGATAGGGLGLGIVVGILIWCCCSKRTNFQPRYLHHVEIGRQAEPATARPLPFRQVQPADNVLPQHQIVKQFKEIGSLPYETVQTATDNFKEKIGQGSYGSVYHGWLNDREVAVKMNNIESQQGQEEFITEVDILTRVHHRNLVSLIGFCNEGNEHILIYEFQVNGTLHEWLHTTKHEKKTRGTLDWKTRLQIALDAAKGLEYLHKGCDPTIIHRDVKSKNILLDEKMTAKVADFGISKSTPIENSRGYSTVVKGTRGYLDPEYHKLERLTHKSDIYSFGVVLAEIITGRSPFEMQTEDTMVILLEFVQKLVETNNIEGLADPCLRGEFNPESVWTMADIVLSCTNPVGARRPDMTQVVSSITEAIDIEKPFARYSPIVSSHSFSLTRSSTNLRYTSL